MFFTTSFFFVLLLTTGVFLISCSGCYDSNIKMYIVIVHSAVYDKVCPETDAYGIIVFWYIYLEKLPRII